MMRGTATISTHNGSAVSRGHNVRDRRITQHEPHIDPNGHFEIWKDESLRDFYARTFQPHADAYDSYARSSRQVGNYFDKIVRESIEGEEKCQKIRERNKEHKRKGEKLERVPPVKKPVYEMIVGVYPQGDLELSEAEQREMLREWFSGFESRNPGLKIVGAYYHADEPEAEPHLHIDYVPVGTFSKGMAVQNSLEKGLAAGGFRSGKVLCNDGLEHLRTAQELWEAAENARLQQVCEAHGLDIIRPQRGKRSQHASTAELKLARQFQDWQDALDAQEQEQARKQASIESQQRGLNVRAAALAKERKRLDDQKQAQEARERALDARQAALEAREASIPRLAAEAAQKAAEAEIEAAGRERRKPQRSNIQNGAAQRMQEQISQATAFAERSEEQRQRMQGKQLKQLGG